MEILDEDNHLIVCYKEAGILSQSDITGAPDLLNILKNYIKEKYNKPGAVYLGLVHRLDRNTEGIMVYARTSKAASRLSEEIRNNNINKKYLAVLDGKFGQIGNKGQLKDKLYKDEKDKKSIVSSDGKEAILDYEVIDQIMENNKYYTLVKINLITGRFHQIRAQFSSRGYPLSGDKKYGSKNGSGYNLVSYHLEFIHPTLKEKRVYNYFKPSKLFLKFYTESDFLTHYGLV